MGIAVSVSTLKITQYRTMKYYVFNRVKFTGLSTQENISGDNGENLFQFVELQVVYSERCDR